MFAPWCPTCSTRVLLGPRRVEAMETGPDGCRVVLRCFCDELLVWSAASEANPAAGADRVPTAHRPPPADLYQPAAVSASR